MTDNPLRILICEDDDRLAELVTETLDADGRYLVVARAHDGEEAVRLTAEHSPDVVLMDIGMPGIDGIDATRAIHARDAGQHVDEDKISACIGLAFSLVTFVPWLVNYTAAREMAPPELSVTVPLIPLNT